MVAIVKRGEYKDIFSGNIRPLLEAGVWGFLNEDIRTFGTRKEPQEKTLPKGTIVRITSYFEGKVGINSHGVYPGFHAMVDLDSFEYLSFEGK